MPTLKNLSELGTFNMIKIKLLVLNNIRSPPKNYTLPHIIHLLLLLPFLLPLFLLLLLTFPIRLISIK